MRRTSSPRLMQDRRTSAAIILLSCAAAFPVAAQTPAYDSNGSEQLMNVLGASYVSAHHGRLTDAIAKDSRVIAQSPNFGVAYLTRATHYMDAGLYDAAAADLDRVGAMHPDSDEIESARTRLALLRGDALGALAHIKTFAKLPEQTFWHSPFEAGADEFGNGHLHLKSQHAIAHMLAYSSIAELMKNQNDAALADMDAMLKIEITAPWHVLNDYCFIAGVAGQLDMAELTCQDSISRNPHDTGQYDSLGFAHLRMRAWSKAVADYNTALNNRPDLTFSLYGRGIAKHALGDKAGGDADIAAATKDEPDIANIMKRLGAPQA